MAYPRTIRNFNVFVDGESYFGRCDKATLPELSLKTETFRGGGMDGGVAVDMGTEDMSCELQFSEHSPALLKTLGTRTRFVLRAAAKGEDDHEADSIVTTLGGRITSQKSGELGAGESVPLTLSLAVDYFRLEHNEAVAIEIDIRNGKRVVGGEDQLAAMRAAMAL